MQARPAVEAIDEAFDSSPRAELVVLVERAIGCVGKVILEADDSDGPIGELGRERLDLHARACDGGNADPLDPARWMIRFRFDGQDFFEVDPVRYAGTLGHLGIRRDEWLAGRPVLRPGRRGPHPPRRGPGGAPTSP